MVVKGCMDMFRCLPLTWLYGTPLLNPALEFNSGSLVRGEPVSIAVAFLRAVSGSRPGSDFRCLFVDLKACSFMGAVTVR